MGFEEDLAAIRRLSVTAEAPHPSGKPAAPWTLMFSATWTARTAKLAKAMLAPSPSPSPHPRPRPSLLALALALALMHARHAHPCAYKVHGAE